MTPQSFQTISALVRKQSGLVLTPEKTYLLEARLTPVARKWQMATLDDLATSLKTDTGGKLARDVVEAMTTNESFFFRDQKPFEQFKDVLLPRLMPARAAKLALRVWCAACSNGQEPYSIAMLIKEAGALFAGWRIEIVATDISREVLAKAKAGVYTQFEVQRGLPIQLLVKYFTQSGERWNIDPSLKSLVTFREFNLLENPAGLGTFDVIFCRNVLIYFDHATKSDVLGRIASLLAPDGALYLGGAETVIGVSTRFAPMPDQRGIYELSGAAPSAKPAATAHAAVQTAR